jgi:hypothetical protein
MTPKQAVAFVQTHGIVLESAHGPVPNLAEAVAGEPIRGGWWKHPKGKDIFAATRAVRDSSTVLVCRLVDGKVTYIHRRFWPALVRLAEKLSKESVAAIQEDHTASGRHRVVERPFPSWVPPEVIVAANELSEEEAVALLGSQVVKAIPLGATKPRKRHRR